MNDNRAPARPSEADEKRAHDDAVRLIAEKFGRPEGYWDRRRALKERRTDIE